MKNDNGGIARVQQGNKFQCVLTNLASKYNS